MIRDSGNCRAGVLLGLGIIVEKLEALIFKLIKVQEIQKFKTDQNNSSSAVSESFYRNPKTTQCNDHCGQLFPFYL